MINLKEKNKLCRIENGNLKVKLEYYSKYGFKIYKKEPSTR